MILLSKRSTANICQTSTHLRDYTFGQIIEVFNKLLENDMEDVRPLYVMLRSRANFSKRYDVCKSSAIDGKGLSEVMIFRDESESQEDLAANTENAEFDDTGAEGVYDEGHHGILDDGSKNVQENGQAPGSPQTYQETESWDNNNEQHGEKDKIGALSSQHTGPQESHANTDKSNPPDVAHTKAVTVASTRDEDDLIDYSDEEPNTKDHANTSTAETHDLENQAHNGTSPDPCLEPNICFCSNCLVLVVEEYEVVNEEQSHSAGKNGALQIGNDEDQNTSKVEANVETENFEDELDYEVDSKAQEALVTNNITDESGKDRYDAKPLEEQNFAEVERIESGQQLHAQEASFQEIQDNGENYEEDFDLGEENPQNTEAGGFDAVDFQEEEYNGLDETRNPIDDNTGLLEFDDAVESSATVSADEPHQEDDFTDLDLDEIINNGPAKETNPVATLPDEDEIDYEDDGDIKDVDVTIVQPPISTTPNGSTKRSISEVEVDEITASGAQGMFTLPERSDVFEFLTFGQKKNDPNRNVFLMAGHPALQPSTSCHLVFV